VKNRKKKRSRILQIRGVNQKIKDFSTPKGSTRNSVLQNHWEVPRRSMLYPHSGPSFHFQKERPASSTKSYNEAPYLEKSRNKIKKKAKKYTQILIPKSKK
jgi:hypothetical protein